MTEKLDDARLPQALTADLIHELRQPLMELKLGLGSLQGELGAQLAAAGAWPHVLAGLTQLEQLLQTWQQVASPEEFAPGWFDPGPMLRQVLEACRSPIEKLGARFVFEPAEPPLQAWGSALTSSHALKNVLLNALDAAEARGAEGRVALRVLAEQGGSIELRVSDSGPGLSTELSARVFDSGFTTRPLGKGSGLGLSIARRLMKANGGDVRLVPVGDSQRLPWATTELALAYSAPASTPLPVQLEVAPAKVLLVEDDPVIRHMLERGMKLSGLTVVSTESADEALSLFGKSPFDAVVTDKNLRGTSTGGLEVARVIRQANPHVALVMVTGYASIESARTMRELGADEYLTKPFEIDSLVLAVSRAVERRRNERSQRTAGPRVWGGPRRVLITDLDDKERARLVGVLGDLKCVPLKRDRLARALEELANADALIVDGTAMTDAARRLLRDLRAARPDFRVVLVGSSETLMRAIDVILLDAHELVRPWTTEQAVELLRRAFGLEGGG